MTNETEKASQFRIPVGISSCLVGQPVRYDGDHKLNLYITETLGKFMDFKPVCPETAIGLGVPRPPIKLVSTSEGTRVKGVEDSSLDVTDQLHQLASKWVKNENLNMCGFIFKSRSPSCGVKDAVLFDIEGNEIGKSSGMFSGSIMEQLTTLPVIQEQDISIPEVRTPFLEQVLLRNEWLSLIGTNPSPGKLVEFHASHKFTVLAHDEPGYRELGNLVSEAGTNDIELLSQEYFRKLMEIMKIPATREKHSNVLMHIFGYLKTKLNPEQKKKILEEITEYRKGLLPLISPISVLRHYFKLYPDQYMDRQYYLSPHPLLYSL